MAERREGARPDRAVFVISVAAELAGMHPQTLRMYERKGLLRPERTSGNSRRYSELDIERLRLIQELTQEAGVNLAGVKRIMELQREVDRLQARVRELEERLQHRMAIAMPGRVERTEIVPLRTLAPRPWSER
jgi:MerR family transcriptional regulator/heat shock protein HspR